MFDSQRKTMPRAMLAIATVLTAAWSACAAAADDYPSKPVTLVVGFPPGGSNDIVARIFAPHLGKALGTSVVVENRPGANATIGTDYTVRAVPDGYTLTLGSASPLAISPHTYANLPHDPLTDLAGITTVAATPEVIAVNPDRVPAKTLQELVALAKDREVTLASSGNGGLPHLAIELFKTESGGQIMHVPYRGAGPAVTDAAGGHVDGVIMDLPALHAMVQEGKLIGLAVADEQRSDAMPDLPTTAELGLPSVKAFNWFAVMAPRDTPKPVIDKLHAALVEVADQPEVRDSLAKLGIAPFTQPSPEAFMTFMKEETERWGEVARQAGAKADQ